MTSGVRVGVDVGGTFTDLVASHPSGAVWSCKVPSTPATPAAAVLNGIATLEPRTGPWTSLAHGTTLVTNAIVEHRSARVGLVTTRGFRDVLEIARQNRSHLYRLDLPAKPDPIVPRHLRLEITERLGPDGAVGTHGGGDLYLDLRLGRQAGKFDQELVLDANRLRLLEARRKLLDGRLGRVVGFGQEFLDPALELVPDLRLLVCRAGEEGDPILVEGRRRLGRGLAGGGQLLALEVREFGALESELGGPCLGRQHLGPGRVVVLLGEGLSHLLREDEPGDQGKRPQHHPNSERVAA